MEKFKNIPSANNPESSIELNRSMEWQESLKQDTIQKLIEKRKELFEMGVLDTTGEHEITNLVKQYFQKLASGYKKVAKLRYKNDPRYFQELEILQNSDFYRETIRLMAYAGSLTPIVAGDWSIQRIEKAQDALGISSLHKEEKTIAEDIGIEGFEPGKNDFWHVHMGAGNGVLMDWLRHNSHQYIGNKKTSEWWKEIGVGYELHHDPTDIIEHFIKDEFKNDPAFRKFLTLVLKPLIKTVLKKTWFKEEDQSGIREHIPKTTFFDNNLIFKILANLDEWMNKKKERYIEISVDFESDAIEIMDESSHYLLLSLLGLSEEEIEKEQAATEAAYIEEEKREIKKNKITPLNNLLTILNKAKEKKRYLDSKHIFKKNKAVTLKKLFTHTEKLSSEIAKMSKVEIREALIKAINHLEKEAAFYQPKSNASLSVVKEKISENKLLNKDKLLHALKNNVEIANIDQIYLQVVRGEIVDTSLSYHHIKSLRRDIDEKEELEEIQEDIRNNCIHIKQKQESIYKTGEVVSLNELNLKIASGKIIDINELLIDLANYTEVSDLEHIFQHILEGRVVDFPLIKEKIKNKELFDLNDIIHETEDICEIRDNQNMPQEIDDVVIFIKAAIKQYKNEFNEVRRSITAGDKFLENKFQVPAITPLKKKKDLLQSQIKILQDTTQIISKVYNQNKPEHQDLKLEDVLEEIGHINTKLMEATSLYHLWGLIEKILPEIIKGAHDCSNILKTWKSSTESVGYKEDVRLPFERRLNFLEKFFTADFVEGVKNWERYSEKNYQQKYALFSSNNQPLDLNLYCKTFPYNFAPIKFKDLHKIIDKGSAHLITSIRGDSHEFTEDFIEGIKNNVSLLYPGGRIRTDGIKHSYSRVYRLEELRILFQKEEIKRDYRLKVVLDKKTNTPKSIIVQRRKIDGTFSIETNNEQDARDILNLTNNECVQNIEETLERIDLGLLNEARKLILTASIEGKDIDLIKEFTHDEIRHLTRRVFLNYAHEQWGVPDSHEENNAMFQSIIDGEVKINELGGGEQEWDALLQSLVPEIANLISKSNRAAAKAVPGVVIYNAHELHTFVRIGQKSCINQHCSITPKKIGNNKRFESIEVREYVKNSILRIKNNLEKSGIKKPLILANFDGCITNTYLQTMLINMDLGNFIAPDDYNINTNYRSDIKKNVMQAKGIFIGGGSFYNVYEREGKLLQDLVGYPLLERFEDPIDPILGFVICFSYQLFADIIGQKYYEGKMGVVPGALEFGPTPIQVIEKNHPLFKQCFPLRKDLNKGEIFDQMVVAQTRVGHWDEKRINAYDNSAHAQKRKYSQNEANRIMRVLAIDKMTGKGIAYEAANGNLLGVQWHPEIPVTKQGVFQKVFDQMDSKMLNETYKIKEQTILNNPKITCPRMQGDSGEITIVNALEHLSKKLLKITKKTEEE